MHTIECSIILPFGVWLYDAHEALCCDIIASYWVMQLFVTGNNGLLWPALQAVIVHYINSLWSDTCNWLTNCSLGLILRGSLIKSEGSSLAPWQIFIAMVIWVHERNYECLKNRSQEFNIGKNSWDSFVFNKKVVIKCVCVCISALLES